MKYVYAIRYGKYVKIGITADPAQRFRSRMYPFVLTPPDLDESEREALCALPGELDTERFIHELLAEYRVSGEFFVLPDALVEQLRRFNQEWRRNQLFKINGGGRRVPASFSQSEIGNWELD